MNSRWKKVWADFWGSPGRTALTILIITVGTFAVGFISNLSQYMAVSMESDFLSANPSEATLSAHPMTDESVKIARRVPGVEAVEGRSTVGAELLRPDDEKIRIQITGIEDAYALTVNTLKPAMGDSTIPLMPDRTVLLDSSAAVLGYNVGDLIAVELSSGTRRELRLAGYVHSATSYPYSLARFVTAFVTPETLLWLGGERTYDQLAISVAEAPTDADHVSAIAQAVADRIERSGATVDYVYVFQPGHHFAFSQVEAMFALMGVLGWLTVLLGEVLIINTILALMAQQTRQIGIMKATGADSPQILGMYAVLILAFGAASLGVAVPAANWTAAWFGDGMAAWLGFFPAAYTGYTSTLLLQILAALVIPLLAAALPLWNAARMTVREALSDYGIGKQAVRKETAVRRSVLRIPRPVRLSLRNAFRKRARLGLTLFTLVLAGGTFIAVWNLWASFDKVIDDIQGYFLADLNIGFDRGLRLDRVASIAAAVPGVERVEGWLEYPGTLLTGTDQQRHQIMFVAPPADSTLIDPIVAHGRWLTPADENAIVIGNQLQAMFPGLAIGEWLAIELGDSETQWQIIGIYTITGITDVPLVYANYEYISRLLGQPGMVYSLRVITSAHDKFTQKRVENQLRMLYDERGIKVASTQLSTDFVEQQKNQTDIFVYFMLSMAVMIAIVGGLGLMGTMSINVVERTREIGVIRAIGASNLDIQGIVVTEGLVIGILGWLISIALSVPLTLFLAFGVGLAIVQTPLPPVFAWAGVLVWLLGSMVLSMIASALPAHRASTLTVKETLAYE